MKLLALRWIKFNFVGAIGIAVQLGALQLLVRIFQMHYLWATALAVEAAVLHNFVWHERFTWKDRASGPVRDMLLRLLRFHMGNGLVSIGGNLLLMRLFVGVWHWKLLLANAVTILICSLLNFAVSEWFVFRR